MNSFFFVSKHIFLDTKSSTDIEICRKSLSKNKCQYTLKKHQLKSSHS